MPRSPAPRLALLLPLLAVPACLAAGCFRPAPATGEGGSGSYLFCFWNVENFFDDRDDGRKRHPDRAYDHWFGTDREAFRQKLANLTRALDRIQRVYGSRKRFPIWNTEYGYLTSPPKHPDHKTPWVAPNTAAYYLNWAEYISWRNPRISSSSDADPSVSTSTDPDAPTDFCTHACNKPHSRLLSREPAQWAR